MPGGGRLAASRPSAAASPVSPEEGSLTSACAGAGAGAERADAASHVQTVLPPTAHSHLQLRTPALRAQPPEAFLGEKPRVSRRWGEADQPSQRVLGESWGLTAS